MMSAKKDILVATVGGDTPKRIVVIDDEAMAPMVVASPTPPTPPEPYTATVRAHARQRRSMGAFGALLALGFGMGMPLTTRLGWGTLPEPVALKQCVRCGTEHQHPNAFCSADCCRLYKEEQRRARR